MVKKGYMVTPYQNLVNKLGEEGAKLEMARRAKLRKTPTGFALLDKETLTEITKKGNKASYASKIARKRAESQEL